MLYDSTKTLLQGILRTLEAADEAAWDGQIESCNQALYEMHQMSAPSYKPYKTDRSDAKWPSRVPDSEKLIRAMPHVKTMASAIRRRDQATALVSGRAALAAM
jgi:hypothetical protein